MQVEGLNFVKYYNQTVFGKAGIHWLKEEDKFLMNVTVPVSSRATIFIPGDHNSNLTESGKPLSERPFVQYIGWPNGYHEVKTICIG